MLPPDERGFRVEEVLTIMHVKDGKAPFHVGFVHGGEIDKQVATHLHQP
jgi:hypothetical protein